VLRGNPSWPDQKAALLEVFDSILLYRERRVVVEVKSSSDKLSMKQKRWIADNATRLHFPFQLLKLHRATARPRSLP
jgi:VRR-NUC domain